MDEKKFLSVRIGEEILEEIEKYQKDALANNLPDGLLSKTKLVNYLLRIGLAMQRDRLNERPGECTTPQEDEILKVIRQLNKERQEEITKSVTESIRKQS